MIYDTNRSIAMLDSNAYTGSTEQLPPTFDVIGYDWVKKLPNRRIHLSLILGAWADEEDLPLGYEFYIVSFHYEQINLVWLHRQSDNIKTPIIVLHDGKFYNYTIPGITFISYYTWHYQLDKMILWFNPYIYDKNISKKASAFCNRITDSKLIVFTAIAEYIGFNDSANALHGWFEPANTFSATDDVPVSIRELSDIFFEKYFGTTYKVDNFSNIADNNNKFTANPNIPALQECAIHFTNESFHYSDISNHIGDYQHPGPYITEKTLKCLLGQTAFVPVGQFDTYGHLTQLGFEFNYNFDTSFDSIIGDHDRLLGIVNLIKQFANMSKEELFDGTRKSSMHNYNHIISGDFYDICENINQKSIEQVLNIIESKIK